MLFLSKCHPKPTITTTKNKNVFHLPLNKHSLPTLSAKYWQTNEIVKLSDWTKKKYKNQQQKILTKEKKNEAITNKTWDLTNLSKKKKKIVSFGVWNFSSSYWWRLHWWIDCCCSHYWWWRRRIESFTIKAWATQVPATHYGVESMKIYSQFAGFSFGCKVFFNEVQRL